jgi:glycylpeptide N-tetradecanoyltransferase
VYTAGVVLPSPVAECRYWHRSLNPKKLVEVGFTRISERMNLARTVKLYKVRRAVAALLAAALLFTRSALSPK